LPLCGKRKKGDFCGEAARKKEKFKTVLLGLGGLAQVGGKASASSSVRFSPHLRQAACSLPPFCFFLQRKNTAAKKKKLNPKSKRKIKLKKTCRKAAKKGGKKLIAAKPQRKNLIV